MSDETKQRYKRGDINPISGLLFSAYSGRREIWKTADELRQIRLKDRAKKSKERELIKLTPHLGDNSIKKRATCHPDLRCHAKGLCHKCYDKQYGVANRERLNANANAWRKKNKFRIREIHRKNIYGISPETFRAMMKKQHGMCAICRTAPAIHLDHDHKTGKAREVLCGNCNRAIGMVKENAVTLRRAISYLKKWNAPFKTPPHSIEQSLPLFEAAIK